MKFYTLFLLVLFLFNITELRAQDIIYFSFDIAGNQVKRSFDNPFVVDGLQDNSIIENKELSEKNDPTKDNNLINLSYYPNPVNDYLHLNWENENNHTLKSITLFNSIGQQLGLYTVQPSDMTKTLNLSTYAQGMYMVVLNYTNGEIKLIKIVKD